MRNIIIHKEPLELFKILKFEGLAENGGAAKAVIEQGLVTVNGSVETRKRKQIVAGDVIEFADQTLLIVRSDALQTPATPKVKTPPKKKRARFPGRASR